MQMLKKIMSWALTLVMVFSVVCGGISTAHAATGDLDLKVEKSDNTVSVSIVAKGALTMGGIGGWLEFDKEAFTRSGKTHPKLDVTVVNSNPSSAHPDLLMFSADAKTNDNDEAIQNFTDGEALITFTFTTTDAYDATKDYNFKLIIDEFYDNTFDPFDIASNEISTTLEGEGGEEPPTPTEGTEVDLSSIVINKVINGTGYDPTTFTFTVTPVDGAPAIDGTFEISTDATALSVALTKATFTTAGTYKYTVKETAGNVDGWTYDETEYTLEILIQPQNPDGELGMSYYKVSKAGDTAKSDSITFTNNYEVTVADLTIMNTNTDNVAAGTEFAYSIVFDATFTDGETTYTANQSADLGKLGDDQSVVIHNIPVGTTFTLTEAAGGTMYKHEMKKGEIISENNGPVTGADLVLKGTIVKENAEVNPNVRAAEEPANYVEIENDLVYEVGTLKVTKEVEGEIDPAYTNKEFSFTVTFTVPEEFANIKILDKDGNEVTGPVTFNLKAGESYDSFTNIPVGTTYVLTEAAAEYFTPSYETGSGKSGNGEYNTALTTESIAIEKDENTITVTNEYSVTPPTGVTIHTEMILILALVLVAMVGSVVLSKKLRRA